VIAARVPDEPTEFTLIESTTTTIEFSWNLPYEGGSDITYFKIYWDSGDRTDTYTVHAFTVDPDTVFIVDIGLTAGEYYAFKLISVNAVGDSVMSESFTYVAASVPGQPGKPYMTSTAVD
jgi:hypothetical protein